MKARKFAVDNPCGEDWNRMKLTPEGRFCETCQKCVVDFTQYTDQQLLAYLKKAGETPCGRYRPDQLNRLIGQEPLMNWPRRAAGFFAGIAAALTLAVHPAGGFNLKPAIPTQVEISTTRESESNPVNRLNPSGGADQSFKISGVVTQFHSDNPISGATVFVKGLSDTTLTDDKGRFTLSLPATFQFESAFLVVEMEGFLQQTVAFDESTVKNHFEVQLLSEAEPLIMGKMKAY